MILLLGAAHPTMEKEAHPHLGRLMQPRDFGNAKATALSGIPWAADNDAFQGWNPERAERYLAMLEAIKGLPGCLFVTLPDVVGDARATADLFNQWHWTVKLKRLPIALVAQDGLEELGVPWDKIDALFIGGSTEFKLGEVAAEFAQKAKERGKWLHMGRVNTGIRVRYAASIGCDSFDGTQFSRWRSTHLPNGLGWAQAGRQLRMMR